MNNPVEWMIDIAMAAWGKLHDAMIYLKPVCQLERQFAVFLRQSNATCKAWDVYLCRMGGRIHIKSFNDCCQLQAEAYSTKVAAFLGIPFVRE